MREEALLEAGIDVDGEAINVNQDVFFADEAIARRLAGRRNRKELKRFMIYPDDRFRAYWDIVMTGYDLKLYAFCLG
jgi:hypothetical protein